jgi:hypothetical protein
MHQCIQTFLHEEKVDFQLTPAGIHRRDTAKRAICMAKNHLIAGLCTVHPKFPLYLWNKLLPQAELTLNMLRGSRLNPKLSAWDQVCGVYDYNCTSIGPQEFAFSCMREHNNAAPRLHTVRMRDTLVLHSTTIAVTPYERGRPDGTAKWTQSVGFHTI